MREAQRQDTVAMVEGAWVMTEDMSKDESYRQGEGAEKIGIKGG